MSTMLTMAKKMHQGADQQNQVREVNQTRQNMVEVLPDHVKKTPIATSIISTTPILRPQNDSPAISTEC